MWTKKTRTVYDTYDDVAIAGARDPITFVDLPASVATTRLALDSSIRQRMNMFIISFPFSNAHIESN